MARPIWTGALSFGLVSVPVGLYPATAGRTPGFHQIERGTSDRIRYRRVNERTGKEVPYRDVVRGARTESGGYVVLEAADLESVAPDRSRSLDIDAFVPADEVEPIHRDRTYYLAPNSTEAPKVYALLCSALERSGRLGLSSLVLQDRRHLALIGPQNGALTLTTLFYADEVRAPEEVLASMPDGSGLSGHEVEMAVRLVEAMGGHWRPEEHRDVHRERLEALIAAKSRGKPVKRPAAPPPRETNVVDLMEALRSSIHRDGGAQRGRARDRVDGAGDREPRLKDMSKRELSRLATSLDVPGRSKMDRAELEEAVRKARRRSARRRKAS
ncbi:DNA end-binding protein Ku [Spinactinospora alkalitolerans]|uniref:Non-homologous end joining protein Ku n=1 Tax=Spinactinospora alkalitolerans TaxID=687207 RepID=A0A852TYL8_9ACTN|nr:Ku protein [Spinactinospora alkalitolerans]NYE48092.1 DNA end-binding protein Ku [Spinactinospora alkalitolerans]